MHQFDYLKMARYKNILHFRLNLRPSDVKYFVMHLECHAKY